MTGPFDSIFGNTPFDLDRDGHINTNEWAFINETLFKDNDADDFDEDDELEDELEMTGLSKDDLEMMDPDERYEALENAGLDSDDFDDF